MYRKKTPADVSEMMGEFNRWRDENKDLPSVESFPTLDDEASTPSPQIYTENIFGFTLTRRNSSTDDNLLDFEGTNNNKLNMDNSTINKQLNIVISLEDYDNVDTTGRLKVAHDKGKNEVICDTRGRDKVSDDKDKAVNVNNKEDENNHNTFCDDAKLTEFESSDNFTRNKEKESRVLSDKTVCKTMSNPGRKRNDGKSNSTSKTGNNKSRNNRAQSEYHPNNLTNLVDELSCWHDQNKHKTPVNKFTDLDGSRSTSIDLTFDERGRFDVASLKEKIEQCPYMFIKVRVPSDTDINLDGCIPRKGSTLAEYFV